jgi:hypothetical protein
MSFKLKISHRAQVSNAFMSVCIQRSNIQSYRSPGAQLSDAQWDEIVSRASIFVEGITSVSSQKSKSITLA